MFLDGFSQLFHPLNTPSPQNGPIQITLDDQASWIAQLIQHILKALDDVHTTKPSLFIEGLDFLLAVGEGRITASEILMLLANLSEVLSSL